MVSYIDENLLNNETVLYRAKVHWAVYIPGVFWAAVAGGYPYLLKKIEEMGVTEGLAPLVLGLVFLLAARLVKGGIDSLFSTAFIIWSIYAFFADWPALSHLQTGGGFFLALLSALTLLDGWVEKTSTELAVTDRRAIAKFGFIRRKTFELNLDRIEGAQIDQSVLGRLLNYGSIRVTGTGGSPAPIPGIDDPLAFRQAVNEAVEGKKGGLEN